MLQVNFSSLDGAVTSLSSARGLLEQQIRDLEAKMGPLLATWEGDAKLAYHALQTQWKTSADQLAGDIEALKNAVHQVGGSYQQTERSVTHTFTV
ncbi:WXG100 family type VII secretion target [Frankia sp. AiPs1]|uniref:WXG100 family type VII secretion target n=1 Tax=Frankia sp. AiPs1 TaxID=573493 RepID=UPI002044C1E2|nr:WXG100 family type VII secretion target [Frankia sp. AiPs1]MCM3926116.1 WXG100 family type VII secretion target [Frankia sp. AiPs1]